MEKRRGRRAIYCEICWLIVWKVKDRAGSLVLQARKKKLLAPPTNFECKDCGAPAVEYDHRDYTLPLEVDPVCHSCNMKRGPTALFSQGSVQHFFFDARGVYAY